jgi:hypothetical protein
VVIEPTPEHRLSEFTIALWVFPQDPSFDFTAAVARDGSFRLEVTPQPKVSVVDGITSWLAAPSSMLPGNVWTHVAFTYSRVDRRMEVFVGGRLEGERLTATDVSSDGMVDDEMAAVVFGEVNGNYFQGGLDEIRIYDQVLEPSAIQLLNDGSG